MTTTVRGPGAGRDEEHGAAVSRLAGWTGVAFAATFVVGFVLVAQVPPYDDPDAAWVEWVEGSGDRVPTVIGTLLLSAAGLLLMAFLTSLAAHVRGEAVGAESPLVRILRGAGVMAGAALMFAALIGGAMSAGVTFAPEFDAPSADIIRALDQLSLALLLVGVGWSTALAIVCASRVASRHSTLPGWLTIGGYVVAVALVCSVLFLPIVLIPIWALITGITLLRAGRAR